MLKIVAALLTVSTLAIANEDLTLPGERWEAKASGYVCDANSRPVSAPDSFKRLNVQFEFIRTDYSLDNGLIKATFIENKSTCSYSALLKADNAASTIALITSRAWAPDRSSNCQTGKAYLDQHLHYNKYLYWGRPHHISIMMPSPEAKMICGNSATHVGLDFTVYKKIDQAY